VDKKRYANDLYEYGYNCAQRTLLPFAEECGLEREPALKLASGFGAGLQHGGICGAISSGVMVLGMLYGHTDGKDAKGKHKIYNAVIDLCNSIEGKYNTLLCKEIIGVDITNPSGRAFAEKNNLFQTKCKYIINDVIDSVEEIRKHLNE